MEASEPTGGHKRSSGVSLIDLTQTNAHFLHLDSYLLLLVCFSFKMFNLLLFFQLMESKNISSPCELTKAAVCSIHTELLAKEISLIHLANVKEAAFPMGL